MTLLEFLQYSNHQRSISRDFIKHGLAYLKSVEGKRLMPYTQYLIKKLKEK